MVHEGKTGRNVEEITAAPLSLYKAEITAHRASEGLTATEC